MRSSKPVRRPATGGSGLLDRILNTPGVEHLVPQLHPHLLHRVIQTCGLEDCAEIVALATPEQLEQIFDLDLWRAAKAGQDEEFDASRFGLWIHVLLESGPGHAAEKLAEIDVDLVIAGLAQHARVFYSVAVTPFETTDGELMAANCTMGDELSCEVGGYQLEARQEDFWDSIVQALRSLEDWRPDYFNQVMEGCRSLSNSGYEEDGLVDVLSVRDQDMFDLSVDREQRQEKQGYVAPAQARAFLQMSRELNAGSDAIPNPIAGAYLQAIDRTAIADAARASSSTLFLTSGAEAQSVLEDSAEAVADIVEALHDSGILAQPTRTLRNGSDSGARRLEHIRTRMEFARDQDLAAYLARSEELAFLANTLIAGCSIQGRRFTTQEASDAAIAICNLGLENWPTARLPSSVTVPPLSFLLDHDIISVFQVGWEVLHNDVALYAAKQLLASLEGLRYNDLEIQSGLDALRVRLTNHWRAGSPWLARGAMDVIAIVDVLVWMVLLGLIDECPVLHAGVTALEDPRTLAVSASDFEFISENSQIASVHKFMQSLQETLRRVGL